MVNKEIIEFCNKILYSLQRLGTRRFIFLFLINAFSFHSKCQSSGIDIYSYYGSVESYMNVERLWDIEIRKEITDQRYYFMITKLYDEELKLLYRSVTRTFQIQQPIFSFPVNVTRVSPYESTWEDAVYYRKMQKSGYLLIPGRYYVEYTLVVTTNGCNWSGEVVFRKRIPLKIDFFNLVELVYPNDKDTLYTRLPMFSWLPVIQYSEDVQYVCKIIESAANGYADIYLTIPYAEFKIQNQTNILYPSTARLLEEGKTYWWTVEAINERGKVLARAKPYSFYVASTLDKQKDEIPLNPLFSYIVLNEEAEKNHYFISTDTLYLAYYCRGNVNDKKISYELVNLITNMIEKMGYGQNLVQLNNGMNLFRIFIKNLKEGSYRMKITDPYDGYQYEIKFTRQKKS